IESFLARWIYSNPSSSFTPGWSSGTYWRALEVGGMCGLTMCVAAALAKAIGIEAEARSA
ncbi:MAG: hypothetical protein ACKO96_43280, partial [Flammeovirgaceae bacterium]